MGCSPSGYAFTSIPDTVAGWVQRNGCTGPEKLYLEQDDGRCMRQGSCSWGADVVLCGVEGQGHTWAGGLPRRMVLPRCREAGEGGQSATFDTNTVLWRFFREHPLPVER
jgi:poly(3-hydroxybutyrate) depolymerase